MSDGGDGPSNAIKDVRENKTALRSESRMECNKGKKYSFLCPIFGYTIMGENARGSIYGWVGRFTICMVSALYQLKDVQIVPYWCPDGLVRYPDLYLLQAQTKKVRFEWEHFLMTVRRLLPHEVISTMNSESVWLAIAEITISRERSQHFLLKGRSSGIELILCKCIWVCAERRPTLIHKQNNKWHHNYSI